MSILLRLVGLPLFAAAMSSCTLDGLNGAEQPISVPPTDVNESVIKAAKALAQAKCFETDKLMTARYALEQAPQDNIQARLQLARFHLINGSGCTTKTNPYSLRFAERELRRALKLDPKSSDALIQLGNVLSQQGRHEEAIQALDSASAIDRKNAMLNVNYARAYLAEGDYPKAFDRIKMVPACRAGLDAEEFCGGKIGSQARIDIYVAMDDRESALKAYQGSTEAFPESAFMHGNFANYLLHTIGDVDAAISEAEKALAIRSYGMAQRTLSVALYAKWAQLLPSDPATAKSYRDRATTLVPELEFPMAQIGCGIGKNNALQLLFQALRNEHQSADAQDAGGVTALINATACGRLEDVRWLLNHGASVDARDGSGATPLIIAAGKGDAEKFRLLISNRADINAVDSSGFTPLINAVLGDQVEIVKNLINIKADINIVDINGNTALVYAVMGKNIAMAQLLLGAGANAKFRSRDGLSLSEIAARTRNEYMVKLIESTEAVQANK